MKMKNIPKKAITLFLSVSFFSALIAAPAFGVEALSSDKNNNEINQKTIAPSNNNINDDNVANTFENNKTKNSGSYTAYANECSEDNLYLNAAIVIFIALIFWSISPIGILFFLSAGTLLKKSSSGIKKKIAWGVQGISFLVWSSLMLLLLIAYADSVSYKIFNLGGNILNVAIISGLLFFTIMILIVLVEKMLCDGDGSEKQDKKEKEREDEHKDEEKKNKPRNGKKDNDSIKIAGIEFKGAKSKVKDKIKKIINEEIDKRL